VTGLRTNAQRPHYESATGAAGVVVPIVSTVAYTQAAASDYRFPGPVSGPGRRFGARAQS